MSTKREPAPLEAPTARDRVVEHVRLLIERGAMKRGDRLPGERDLATELGVSRPSVRSGLEALEAMGVVVSRRGAGTFIAEGPPDLGIEPLGLPAHKVSLHVIESDDPASTLLEFAKSNNVDLIVLGAPWPKQKKLAWLRSVASNVTANAHCSVHVVRVTRRQRASTAAGVPTHTEGGPA